MHTRLRTGKAQVDSELYLMNPTPSEPKPRRSLFQFRLPTVSIVAIAAVFVPALHATLVFLGDTHPAQSEKLLTPEIELSTARVVSQYKADTRKLTAIVKKGDTVSSVFRRLGLNSSAFQELASVKGFQQACRHVNIGDPIDLVIGANGAVQSFTTHPDPFVTHTVLRKGDKLVLTSTQHEYETRMAFAQAIVDSSLFEAGQSAHLPTALTLAMATIFGWDIDFALDIRDGDSFSVLYEQQLVGGEKVRDGEIVAAEFINQGKIYRAVRRKGSDGRSEYFSPEGAPMRKAFLRTPVDFNRISSFFGKRRHPILNTLRDHKGVDYAADRGTPIRAAGEGSVVFRGVKGGYGNTVILMHGRSYSTLYGHMNGFAKGVQLGGRIHQGQVIGYVGSSGMATGPHLHYELRVNGIHQNPLSIKAPSQDGLTRTELSAFLAQSTRVLAKLDSHKRLSMATSL